MTSQEQSSKETFSTFENADRLNATFITLAEGFFDGTPDVINKENCRYVQIFMGPDNEIIVHGNMSAEGLTLFLDHVSKHFMDQLVQHS